MTDHNQLSLDQCRDEIAEKVLGWTPPGSFSYHRHEWERDNENQGTDKLDEGVHPMGTDKSTDAALAAMPKGWEYEVHNRNVGGLISARAIPPTGHWDEAIDAHGETEALCRWRLCLAAWRKEKGL